MGPVSSTEHPRAKVGGSLGINAAHKTYRQFPAVPTDQHDIESGVEYSSMDITGNSFLVRNQQLVVCGDAGIVDSQAVARYVADGLCFRLRKSERSAKGEQAPIFSEREG